MRHRKMEHADFVVSDFNARYPRWTLKLWAQPPRTMQMQSNPEAAFSTYNRGTFEGKEA